tara:strand:- start:1503 stop:2258 length:756 start_codon:yes stop_codon:yes gene_type:complete
MELSAVFFDVDGTIAETEEFHRKSFNESFKEFSLDWFWDEPIYKELINIGGGKERIMFHLKKAWPEMLEYKNLSNYVDSIHKVKNEIYEDYINDSKITARPGVFRLIEELKKKNISIALVSSTSEVNLINLFTKGFNIDPYKMFDLVAHGDCTKLKKPSPEIYEWALQKLQLPSEACIAIEDSPRGLESSNNAKVKTIITPSRLTLDEDFKNAKLVISNLGEPDKPFKIISGKAYSHDYVCFDLLKMVSEN